MSNASRIHSYKATSSRRTAVGGTPTFRDSYAATLAHERRTSNWTSHYPSSSNPLSSSSESHPSSSLPSDVDGSSQHSVASSGGHFKGKQRAMGMGMGSQGFVDRMLGSSPLKRMTLSDADRAKARAVAQRMSRQQRSEIIQKSRKAMADMQRRQDSTFGSGRNRRIGMEVGSDDTADGGGKVLDAFEWDSDDSDNLTEQQREERDNELLYAIWHSEMMQREATLSAAGEEYALDPDHIEQYLDLVLHDQGCGNQQSSPREYEPRLAYDIKRIGHHEPDRSTAMLPASSSISSGGTTERAFSRTSTAEMKSASEVSVGPDDFDGELFDEIDDRILAQAMESVDPGPGMGPCTLQGLQRDADTAMDTS